MPASYLRDTSDGCTLCVRVHPGARNTSVQGEHGGSLKLSLASPAADGRANDALIALLAERLGLPRARVELLTGAASRSKTLRITGRSAAEVEAALSSSVDV